jgi:uncharacterized protein (TIGR03083 family)
VADRCAAASTIGCVERIASEQLLAMIRADRARFDALLGRVPRDRLTDPILPGGWSVRDVLAHVAWGDRQAIGVMQARALVGSELWELPEDQRNAAVVRESRTRETPDVLDEYRASFETYLSELARLTNDDLNDPRRIRGLAERIPDWPPWRVLYDPEHYADHGRAIEAALQKMPPADQQHRR